MESLFILDSSDIIAAGADLGNVAANVVVFTMPVPCVIERAIMLCNTAITNAATVTLDSYRGTTQGAADCGSITIPDAGAAFANYYDEPTPEVKLKAGDQVLVQVDEASGAGKLGFIRLVCRYSPETVYGSGMTASS